MSVTTATLKDNIARVQETIAGAAERSGRHPDEVCLVAISKTHPAETVVRAAELGLTHFGENRVQEAGAKILEVRQAFGGQLEWHLVGTLQRNKINQAVSLFTMIEAVDSRQLAEAIGRRAAGGAVAVLLEVYLGDESARPGFRPEQLQREMGDLLAVAGITIRGLMTVAPLGWDESATRSAFASLRSLRDRLAASFSVALP